MILSVICYQYFFVVVRSESFAYLSTCPVVARISQIDKGQTGNLIWKNSKCHNCHLLFHIPFLFSANSKSEVDESIRNVVELLFIMNLTWNITRKKSGNTHHSLGRVRANITL